MNITETGAARKPLLAPRTIWVIATVTVVLSLAIAVDLTPWLRGPSGTSEWRWGYHPFTLQPLRLVAVALTAALLGGWYGLARQRERVRTWLLIALLPVGLAFQVSVLSTGSKGLELVARVLNPGYFGYYLPATQVADLPELLDTWSQRQASFDHPRLQTHPPGNVVFEWAVYQVVKGIPALTRISAPLVEPRLASLPDWASRYDLTAITGGMALSLLIPAIATASVVPIFLLARASYGEEVARRASLLYLLAPSITLFQPKIDEVFTLVSSATFLLTYVGVHQKRIVLTFLSGLLCSTGLFMSYGMLPLVAINGMFLLGAALATWQETLPPVARRLALYALVFGLGAVSVQVLTALVFGYEPLDSFFVMLTQTRNVNVGRNYWYSLVYTPYDILLFAGVPVAALLFGRVFWLISGARDGGWRRNVKPVDWLLISTLVMLLVSMLTGVERSENARTYLFLVPVIAFFAAVESERINIGWRTFAGLAALTLVQLMVYQAVLEVFL